MKRILVLVSLFFISGFSLAQNFESPAVAFNQAANDYVFEGDNKAINTLNRALREYPEDEKLRALLEKILNDRKQKQQQQKDQNNSEQKKEKDQSENQQQKDQQKENEEQQKEKGQQKQEQEQKQQQEQGEQSDQEKDAEEKEGQPSGQQKEKAEGDKKDEKSMPQINPDEMEDLNISPEKARMILEAMKNNEIQYLQQMRRRPTQRPDSDKPDW